VCFRKIALSTFNTENHLQGLKLLGKCSWVDQRKNGTLFKMLHTLTNEVTMSRLSYIANIIRDKYTKKSNIKNPYIFHDYPSITGDQLQLTFHNPLLNVPLPCTSTPTWTAWLLLTRAVSWGLLEPSVHQSAKVLPPCRLHEMIVLDQSISTILSVLACHDCLLNHRRSETLPFVPSLPAQRAITCHVSTPPLKGCQLLTHFCL
jgi:hypothetical protein